MCFDGRGTTYLGHHLTAESVERRLAAVLAADVAGYSRLMGADEEGTLARLKAVRKTIVEPTIADHRGRIVKTTGDGMLVEFASAVDAVRGALNVQRAMAEHNASMPQFDRIDFRIGLHVGDIIIDDGDIFGEGVNVAARLEAIARPGEMCISNDAYRQVRGKVDLDCDDLGAQSLKNIVEPVKVWRVRLAGQRPSAEYSGSSGPKPLALPEKPSIAVLPFQNMSGDPDQEYFADGIVEDIITALSRFKSLFVIARNSSFTYKGRAVDIKQVARELGVRYVLEGSVRRSSNRIRITAQLIDAETGSHLWAERYDRDMADVFAVQDEITETVAIAIEPAVAQMEQSRAVRKPPDTLSCWEAYQRGTWHLNRIDTTENEAAKTFFRRAIDLDPSFAPAHAGLAQAILCEAWLYQTKSMPTALDEALPEAQKAISLDPLDAVAHIGVGYGRFFRGDHGGALAEARKALSINPNYATAYQLQGSTLVFSGRAREGIEALHMAMRLDPNDLQRHVRLVHISMGYYFLREYETAVETAEQAVSSYPNLGPRSLAAALGQAGRFDEAKKALQKAIAVAPRSFDMYVRDRAPWFRPEDHEHVLQGLRKAGWEG